MNLAEGAYVKIADPHVGEDQDDRWIRGRVIDVDGPRVRVLWEDGLCEWWPHPALLRA